jgi:LuxR family quorum sensing-dependent transcriptional regulator
MTSIARRNFAFDTINKVAQATSLPDLRERFGGAVAKIGFTAFGIAGMPPPDVRANPIIVLESMPAGFRELYKESRLYRINHIAAHVRIVFSPFRYSEAPYDPARGRDRDRVMQILQSFRIARGVCVPVGRPRHIPACIWVGGEDPEIDDEGVQLIQLIGLFTASKAYALSRADEDDGPALTKREREVLTWAAQGKSAWEIGEILCIAKRTVDEHTQTAARKLGATNRTQAVAVALVRHLIEV